MSSVIRYDHDDPPVLPPPCRDLIDGIAEAAWAKARSQLLRDQPDMEIADWRDMSQQYRDDWREIARVVYAQVACAAGVRAELLAESDG